jgi:capsular polysaccharide biosynthesis protein
MPLSPAMIFRFFREKSPQYFWPLFLVFFLVFLMFFLEHFRVYSSEMTFLVAPKSEKTAGAAEMTVNSVAGIPQTLSFYDELLARYPEITDPWKGYSSKKRQAFWSDHLTVDSKDESGLVTVRIKADSASDATMLANRVKDNFFQVIGRYYDIRNDIDLRKVDGPVTEAELYHPLGWIVLSLGFGFLLAFGAASVIENLYGALEYPAQASGEISARIRRMLKPSKEDYLAVKSQLPFEIKPVVPKEAFPEKGVEENVREEQEKPAVPSLPDAVAAIPALQAAAAEAKIPAVLETTPVAAPQEHAAAVMPESKSSAPANLPFLEEGISLEQYLFAGAELQEAPKEKVEEKAADAVSRQEEQSSRQEPTEEELKRRLNQLLRGEL